MLNVFARRRFPTSVQDRFELNWYEEKSAIAIRTVLYEINRNIIIIETSLKTE